MDENFLLDVNLSLEEQAISYRHVSSQVFSRNEFVDCTLCCSDGQIQGHRLILASASNYLHNMLSSTPWPTPCSHPMLFFKTFSVSDMKLALEFIYTGSTKVSKGKLPTLMNVARDLGCSSLSKAIEKAIHSCGVEIFRQRMQIYTQSHAASGNSCKVVSELNHPGVGQDTRKFVSDPQLNVECSSDKPVSETIIPEPGSDPTQTTAYNSPYNNEDQQAPSTEIKVECEESMMLELDPSSIVTTEESNSTENANVNTTNDKTQHFCIPTSDGIRINNGNSQIQQVIDSLIAGSNNELAEQTASEIVDANSTDSTSHIANIETVDDEPGQDGDDEEMPITVVDLKSLAETDADIEGNMIASSQVGTENTDSLPSNCPWCFQIFTSLTLLQRHIKTHVGKYKPHSCPYCPASFARSAHLKRHIRTHTGEKPFTCTLCSRAFSRQDKLKTHLEKHLLEQQLQNNPSLTSTTGLSFSSLTQSNFGGTKPTIATVAKALSLPSSSSVSQLSPQKEVTQNTPTSTHFISGLDQCPTPPVPGYQYFINNAPDSWQNQSDRLSKGLGGTPGQLPTSTTITPTPSTTITPISSFLVYKNATTH